LQAHLWELCTQTDWLVAERKVGMPERPWWNDLEETVMMSDLNGAIARIRDTPSGSAMA